MLMIGFALSLFSVIVAACGEAQSPQLQSARLQQIQQAKKLVIGTALTRPFEYRDQASGDLIGYDVELAKRISQELGVSIEWKEMAFAELIPAVEQGSLDMVIAAMYITPARLEKVDMSQGYVDTGLVIVTGAKTADIRTPADLNGRTLGVKKGSTGARYAEGLKSQGINPVILEYGETIDSLNELEAGAIDAALNDKLNTLEYAKTHPTVQVSSDVLEPAQLGIAVRKGDADLLNLINQTITKLRGDGTLDTLYKQWVSGSGS
jgi:ABC-type amino acid transport substrate-binding protein